eukprot:CAMPEP_0203670962 /NCGR_PEP_ID=MMETSP0090-20130426/6899_1 /ASSEMBLY_ACC=CAM_ASM_001088 /TAXON_ID=426623 /ORGANISM="Chaetoceros affinis, Strain CCMP159" /LENGTH=965 /DNA_ID=CAMNT_0050535951 /DNA_START=198 /DNA_END=3091 /DNA_ORIENTATION=+
MTSTTAFKRPPLAKNKPITHSSSQNQNQNQHHRTSTSASGTSGLSGASGTTSSSKSYSHSSSTQHEQFHKRQNTKTTIPSLPKPSQFHKPPSTTNGDFYLEQLNLENYNGSGSSNANAGPGNGGSNGNGNSNGHNHRSGNGLGDVIQSQDIFAAAFKKRNEKLRVLFPGMDRFEMERMDMWNHDSICNPCLIVQPKSNREVSDALTGYTYGVLKCLSSNRKQKTGAANNNNALAIPRLTIASGRNSINAMRNGCIVLDMSRMRSIKVYKETMTCKVQGGVRVIDLDATLSEYGLVAMSSIYQNLGVIGCVLSGGCGFGYASRKFGLACDNVLEAEVVLADGRLKKCSKTRHTDLYYALCGGGGGTGVVVSVTLRCYPLLHAALLTYDIPTAVAKKKKSMGIGNMVGGGHKKGVGEEVKEKRRTILKHWSNWLHGDLATVEFENDKTMIDNTGALTTENILRKHDGVKDDIYSQINIPTKQSSNIQFIATSIDDKAIPQTNGFIERYEEAERKSKRSGFGLLSRLKSGGGNNHSNSNENIVGITSSAAGGRTNTNTTKNTTSSFKQYTSSTEQMKQYGWDRIPGLADLITNKFGVSSRQHVQFKMVRYADQLQSHSNEYFTSGNIYMATKYAMTLTTRIIEILVQATLGGFSPNNESKICVHSLGGKISTGVDGVNSSFDGSDNVDDFNNFNDVAFNARHMKYVIYIEGRWEAAAEHKYMKEKQKVMNWVHWVVNQLHRAEGVQSTSHPESIRDQVSKSGRTKPPAGWYNFDERSGKKLMEIKNKRDPKNVFSLASRISWLDGSQFMKTEKNNNNIDKKSMSSAQSYSTTPVKDGEIDPTDCLTPKKIHQTNSLQIALESLSTDDAEEVDNSFDGDDDDDTVDENMKKQDIVDVDENGNINVVHQEIPHQEDEESSVGSDLKRLLSISDCDDDFKDWSFTASAANLGGELGDTYFDIDAEEDKVSP